MNQSPSNVWNRARRIGPAMLGLLLALAGCGKQEPAAEKSPAPQTGAPAAAAKSSTTFNEVTAKLDSGGSVFAYLSTSQWLEGLSTRINTWRPLVLGLPGIDAEARTAIEKSFDIAGRLIKTSGVEEISGVGLSGIALEKGFYQTKFVVHRKASGAPGGVWSLFGKASRPLNELDWLPATTAWAAFSEFEAAALWSTVAAEVEKSGFPEAQAGLAQLNAIVQQSTGLTLDKLLGSLGGQFGVVLTLNEEKKLSLPIPFGTPLEIPEPALALVLKVKDGTLFDLIDRFLQTNPQVTRSDKDGVKTRTMPLPLPLPLPFTPTVVSSGEYLFLATNDRLVEEMFAVKAGKQPGLKSTDDFKRLVKGLPLEGNSFTYIGKNLGTSLLRLQSTIMNQMAQQTPELPMPLLQKLITLGGEPGSAFGLRQSGADGWLTISRGSQDPAAALLLPVVVAPVAIGAGMLLPALAQAKMRAQGGPPGQFTQQATGCTSNLKQLGLAARIYSTDHNDVFPPNILAMKAELVSPKLLICPQAPNAALRNTLTWENLDLSQISYEYLAAGAKETTPGFATNVVFRCRIHGDECLGDGTIRNKAQAR